MVIIFNVINGTNHYGIHRGLYREYVCQVSGKASKNRTFKPQVEAGIYDKIRERATLRNDKSGGRVHRKGPDVHSFPGLVFKLSSVATSTL